jgi:hypothetical protein
MIVQLDIRYFKAAAMSGILKTQYKVSAIWRIPAHEPVQYHGINGFPDALCEIHLAQLAWTEVCHF